MKILSSFFPGDIYSLLKSCDEVRKPQKDIAPAEEKTMPKGEMHRYGHTERPSPSKKSGPPSFLTNIITPAIQNGKWLTVRHKKT